MLADSSVEVYGEPDNKNAEEIVRNGLAKVGNADVVIVDTAGRDRLDDELQAELERIHKVANATERFLVIDASSDKPRDPLRPVSMT